MLGSCLATACTVCETNKWFTRGKMVHARVEHWVGLLLGEMICFLTTQCRLEEEVAYFLDYDESISEYKGVSLVVHFAVQDFD